jgi:hypothetical protein
MIGHPFYRLLTTRALAQDGPLGRGSCYKTMRVAIVVAVENLHGPLEISFNPVSTHNLHATGSPQAFPPNDSQPMWLRAWREEIAWFRSSAPLT